MGRRTGRDDERRMPNCCRWGALILPLAGGGAWRRWVVMRVVTPHSQLPTAVGTRQSSPEASLLSSAIWPEKASLPAEVSAYQRTMCRLESDSRFSTVA